MALALAGCGSSPSPSASPSSLSQFESANRELKTAVVSVYQVHRPFLFPHSNLASVWRTYYSLKLHRDALAQAAFFKWDSLRSDEAISGHGELAGNDVLAYRQALESWLVDIPVVLKAERACLHISGPYFNVKPSGLAACGLSRSSGPELSLAAAATALDSANRTLHRNLAEDHVVPPLIQIPI